MRNQTIISTDPIYWLGKSEANFPKIKGIAYYQYVTLFNSCKNKITERGLQTVFNPVD